MITLRSSDTSGTNVTEIDISRYTEEVIRITVDQTTMIMIEKFKEMLEK